MEYKQNTKQKDLPCRHEDALRPRLYYKLQELEKTLEFFLLFPSSLHDNFPIQQKSEYPTAQIIHTTLG